MSTTNAAMTVADQIVGLERTALDRWGRGDPGGFLEIYASDITYFDPLTERRLDGHDTLVAYYAPFVGKIEIPRYEMLNARVVAGDDLAVLSYNLVNYVRDADGVESVGSRWNSTAVYQRRGETWQSVHSHWSFTQHPAFLAMTPATSERAES